jgi:two-component system, NtrC family, response regulator HydG
MPYLVRTSGPEKGMSWPIQATPIQIGRSTSADIIVSDSAVSRRHCEVSLIAGRPTLVDLGSSNRTLVNGEPTTKCELRSGDEMAVGPAVFLVIDPEMPGEDARLSDSGMTHTMTISPSEGLMLRDEQVAGQTAGRPKTVNDLAELYNIGRQISQASTLDDLLAILVRRLRARFQPAAMWVGRYHSADKDLHCYNLPDGGADNTANAPVGAMKTALEEEQAKLVRGARTPNDYEIAYPVLVAPLVVSGGPIGALALALEKSSLPLDDGDLEFLYALAHQAAPFFVTVEREQKLTRDVERLRAQTGESSTLIGVSLAMKALRTQVREAAETDLNCLILGETGTGKELAARMIHDISARANEPFVVLNCAAIPHELMESELFGHMKGAFTGAHQDKTGRFEQANGGTLFLDEVGDLSPHHQAGVLRAIEQGTFHRIGSEQESRVNVRVVAATNRDLNTMMRDESYRSDLYHRLNGFEIKMPALRDRKEDIPELAKHFLELGRERAKRPLEGFTNDAFEHLQKFSWPGNVRELKSVVDRAIALCKEKRIGPENLVVAPPIGATTPAAAATGAYSPRTLSEVEKDHIAATLTECGGNVREAAKILGIGRSTLYNKIAEYQIST